MTTPVARGRYWSAALLAVLAVAMTTSVASAEPASSDVLRLGATVTTSGQGQRVVLVRATGRAAADSVLAVSWDRTRGPCPAAAAAAPPGGGWAIAGDDDLGVPIAAGAFARRGTFPAVEGRIRLCGYLTRADAAGDVVPVAATTHHLTVRPPANGATRRPERGWRIAASRLSMPVYRPTYAPGVTLRRVVARTLRACGNQQVEAIYTGPGRGLLRVYEGKPYYCGDWGDARGLGTTRIRGRTAHFLESPNFDNQGGMVLFWYTARRPTPTSTAGIQISIEVRGHDKARTARIARSLRLVR